MNPINFRLDHVGIAVRDLKQSIRFYGETLGFEISGAEPVEAEAVRVVAARKGDGTWLELLEPSSEESVIGRFIDRNGPGLHHLALRVANLEDAMEQMKAAQFSIVGEPRIGVGGSRVVFLHPRSTGGVLIELVESKES